MRPRRELGGRGLGRRHARTRTRSRSSRRRRSSPTSSRTSAASRVAATSIIPPGVGPEDYEPKPDDARKLADAQLIVSNGVGLDDFLDDLLASGTGGQTPHLVLGEGIPVMTVDGEDEPALLARPDPRQAVLPARHRGSADRGRPGRQGDLRRERRLLRCPARRAGRRTQGRGRHDPGGQPQARDVPRRVPVLRAALRLRARRGRSSQNVGQEPSAADLAALVETVRAAGVKAVFSEAQFSPKLAETLAQEAGITTVVTTLYNDALGPGAGRHVPRPDALERRPDRAGPQVVDDERIDPATGGEPVRIDPRRGRGTARGRPRTARGRRRRRDGRATDGGSPCPTSRSRSARARCSR